MEAMPERRTGGRSWPVGRGLGAASTLHAIVPVFARRDTYDSFEGFAEGRIGLVAHRLRDFDQFLMRLLEQLDGLLHPPIGDIIQRCLTKQFFEVRGKRGPGHTGSWRWRFDGPRAVYIFVNGFQCGANLRIKNRAQPSSLAILAARRNMGANGLNE
jgi:hypothetical protein